METEVITPARPATAQLQATARLIGRSPMVAIQALKTKPGVNVLAKLEWQNLGGSVKAGTPEKGRGASTRG